MNQQHTPTAPEYRDALLERLLGHYLTNTAIPGSSAGLTPALLHRLCRAILAEGYGSRQLQQAPDAKSKQ